MFPGHPEYNLLLVFPAAFLASSFTAVIDQGSSYARTSSRSLPSPRSNPLHFDSSVNDSQVSSSSPDHFPKQQGRVCVCAPSHFSHVQLFVTLWTVARQAPLSMGFSRQGYWSRWLHSPPGDFPNPGLTYTCIGRWDFYH